MELSAIKSLLLFLNMSTKRASSSPAAEKKKIRQEQSASPASTVDLEEECADWPTNLEQPADFNTSAAKQEPPMMSPKFQDGLKRFNGYVCKFLKKPVKLQLFSSAMYITCNNSVAIFGLPRLMRDRLIKKVDEVLEDADALSDIKKNPFKNSTVFLSIGHHARLFHQPLPGADAEPLSHIELKRGLYFHGRLSLNVLGVESHKNELSPMVRVTELFMMADHMLRDKEEDMGICTLEEPLENEDGSEDDGADY